MYRVLIADDESIVLTSLSAIIDWKQLECELVGTSLNGMDAYNKICDFYPDIVITDIKMPLLNGLELIEKARMLDKDIDFIVLSGYDDFAFAQTAMGFGVKYYHLKPARKEEIIGSLRKIVAELKEKKNGKAQREAQFFQNLKLPLQKSFLYDALQQDSMPDETMKHYINLLGFPEHAVSGCICTYLELHFLEQFLQEFKQFNELHRLHIFWPAFYVTNCFVFTYADQDITTQEQISLFIRSRKFPNQSVDLETQFLLFENTIQLFREILRKISRYGTIRLINEWQEPEILNHLPFSGQGLGILEKEIQRLSSGHETENVIRDVFSTVTDVENAVLLSIRLLYTSPLFSAKGDLDYLTIQYLFRSSSVTEVENITAGIFLRQLPAEKEGPRKETLIPCVKDYIDKHLDSETLSLKWLAENRFFISVGYLSKQFQQETGEHFSVYLNRQRIELAKKMMSIYHNNNILEIAQKAGFRNNPCYFGQVFKKHTGQTPSEYLAALKQGELK